MAKAKTIAQRLARDPDFGEHVNPGDREGEGRQVAAGAQAEGGDGDRPEKLDRADGRERQPGDRLVETEFMAASTTPSATTTHRSPRGRAARKRQGRRQSANTAPALAMRSQATPSGAMSANSSTAKDGPR